jgi:Carboxypeptidase regulatory-like domain
VSRRSLAPLVLTLALGLLLAQLAPEARRPGGLTSRPKDAQASRPQPAELVASALALEDTTPAQLRSGRESPTAGCEESPELLGALEGWLHPPPGEEPPPDFPWADVELWWSVPAARRVEWKPGSDGTLHEVVTWDGNRAVGFARSDGSYRLKGLPCGVTLELAVERGLDRYALVRLAPLLPGELRALDVTLERDWLDDGKGSPEVQLHRRLSGLVLDQHGAPLAGAEVWVEPGGQAAESDGDGRFELSGLTPGRWRLSAAHPDQLEFAAPVEVDGRESDVADVLLSVVRGRCIEGSVTWSDGGPVESFWIRTGEAWCAQGEAGRYRLCLPPGTFALEVSAVEPERVGAGRIEGVRAGAVAPPIVLVPRPAHVVRGVVRDVQGRPLAAEVSAWSEEHGPRFAMGAEDGRFELEGLPAGSWSLVARAQDHHEARSTVRVGSATPELRLVLERGGEVRGVVLDPDGAPVADARLWAGREVRTDDQGRFVLTSDSSSLVLWAEKEGFAVSEGLELRVASGGRVEGLVLRLRPACSLEVRVVGLDAGDIQTTEVLVEYTGWEASLTLDADGRLRATDLVAGSARVVATSLDGRSVAGEVELVPGQLRALELRFRR